MQQYHLYCSLRASNLHAVLASPQPAQFQSWTDRLTEFAHADVMVMVKAKVTLEQATKAQRWKQIFSCTFSLNSGGRVSSVGIATRYRLDGPGIESRWGRDFPHPSRPVLGPTQPPVQRVPGLSWG